MNYYLFAQLAGLTAFSLMLVQIFVGSFANKLRPYLGTKVVKIHIWVGITAFILAWLHPLSFVMAMGWDWVKNLGGYAIEGKIAWGLLQFSVAAGLLRTRDWLSKYWRWIHRLNYVIFALVYWHSWHIGSDTHSFPWVLLYVVAPIVLVAGIANKIIEWYIPKYGYR